jgi:putative transposase
VKAISRTLGAARSNVIQRRDGATPRRGPQERPGDVGLAGAIRRLVDARPTYGYRGIAARLKRERRSDGLPPVNTKRVYRLIKSMASCWSAIPAAASRASMTARWALS